MDRDVALKLLHPSMASDPATVERFKHEVEVTTHLAHPRVLQMFDVGETAEGLLYVVMEYLDGEDLEQLLQREGHLSVERAVELARQTLEGLAEIHARDIVHRDLKPSNLFVLWERRGSDFVKILDFGVATSLGDSEQTAPRSGRMCGTPMYMPPEVALQEGSGKPADVYAMGLIVLETMIGRRVFHGDNMAHTLSMQLQHEAPIPDPVRETELGSVLVRATAQHPDDRFRDAAAMLDALDRAARRLPEGLEVEPDDVPELDASDGSDALESAILDDPEASLDDVYQHRDTTSSSTDSRTSRTPPDAAFDAEPTPPSGGREIPDTEELEAIDGSEEPEAPPSNDAEADAFSADEPTAVFEVEPPDSAAAPVPDDRAPRSTPESREPIDPRATERIDALVDSSTVDEDASSSRSDSRDDEAKEDERGSWWGALGAAAIVSAVGLVAWWMSTDTWVRISSSSLRSGTAERGTSESPSREEPATGGARAHRSDSGPIPGTTPVSDAGASPVEEVGRPSGAASFERHDSNDSPAPPKPDAETE
jgi:serine/threonine protein kinase